MLLDQRLLDQLVARGGIGFLLDALDQRIHLRVREAAQVEVTVTACAGRAHQRLQAVERIKRGHAPAQQIDAGFVALDHRKVRGKRQRAQLGLHAHLGPVRGDGLAQLLVVDVAARAARKVHLKAVGVARIGQQLLRGLGVIGVAYVGFLGPAVHLVGNQRAGGLGQAAQHHALDGLDVDGLVQRLAHAQVLQRVLALHVRAGQFFAELVQAQEDGAVLRPFQHLQVGRLLDACQVLQAGVDHEINFTREQRRRARGIGLDGGVDDLGQVGGVLALAPPVRVGLQHHALVGRPLLELVGAGAQRVAVGKGFVLGLDVLGLDRLVLLGPGLAHDAQLGQLVHQHGVGQLGMDVDGVGIDLFHAVNALGVDGEVGAFGLGALQRELGIVGRELAAVAELHALAQRQAQLCGLDELPLGSERRLGLEGLAVVFDQRVVHRAVHGVVHAHVLGVDVPRRNVHRTGPAEGFGLHGQRQGRGQGGREQKGFETHGGSLQINQSPHYEPNHRAL